MIPDPRRGRWLRAYALLAYAACAVLACTRSSGRGNGEPRIVAVGGAITETVFALGAGDRVVAVDTSSVFPSAVDALPKVGYQRSLAAETILAHEPSLVIVSDEAGPPSTLEQLRAAGVRVEQMPGARTPDAAVARIATVAAALDRPAEPLRSQVQREIAAAVARVPADRPRCAIIYARGGGSLSVSGAGTQGEAMVELAGGKNALSGFTGWKPLSAEALVAAAPDVLVLPTRGLASLGGEAGLLATPGVADTPAGKARRIVTLDDLLLLGFGPRLGPAIDTLSAALRSGT
ncbi:MAG: ABC transporter substrate-binding protein [Deltaproteobacteria bacterium]|nr:ABC transporter substrate-binding protein [Deltaproteobacteria bacterium]